MAAVVCVYQISKKEKKEKKKYPQKGIEDC